jgi:hypothetical protein
MTEPRKSQREFWLVVVAGSSLMLLTGAGAYWIKSNAERPQPSFEMAGNGALLSPPVHAFAATEVVGELLESLPPDLAFDVCANLTGDLARKAKRPCDELRAVTAAVPAASPGLFGSAMAALRAEVLITPQLPAASAPVTVVTAPEPAPSIRASVAHGAPAADAAASQLAAEPAPASTAIPGGAVPAGAPIAGVPTTEQAAPPVANSESGVSVAVLVEGTEPPTIAAPDEAMAWLFLSEVPESGATNADRRGEAATAEKDGEAAAAEARAQARAGAEAAAKAKAADAARAQAAAAAFKADRDDSGSSANAGKGKDNDQGAGSNGNSSSGGGNND